MSRNQSGPSTRKRRYIRGHCRERLHLKQNRRSTGGYCQARPKPKPVSGTCPNLNSSGSTLAVALKNRRSVAERSLRPVRRLARFSIRFRRVAAGAGIRSKRSPPETFVRFFGRAYELCPLSIRSSRFGNYSAFQTILNRSRPDTRSPERLRKPVTRRQSARRKVPSDPAAPVRRVTSDPVKPQMNIRHVPRVAASQSPQVPGC